MTITEMCKAVIEEARASMTGAGMDYKDYAGALSDRLWRLVWDKYGEDISLSVPDGHDCPRAFQRFIDTLCQNVTL